MKAHWRAQAFALGLIALLLTLGRTAVAQKVSLSRTSLDFGTHTVGKQSSALNVILTNSDKSVPLAIGTITASGDYSQSNDCKGLVAPLGICTLLITFKPNTAGTVTGVVTINDDATNSPQLITVAGKGIDPLTVTPTSLTFGTVAVGSTSSGQTVTLTNDLSKTVTIGFTVSSDYAAAGSGATPCGTSLASKGSCTIAVKFKPTVAGAINGSLLVTQNINSTSQIVTFSGTGSGGSTPPLSFKPSTLSFGTVGVGGSSTKNVVVTNNSSKTVTISALAASSNYMAAGGSTSPCGGALTAGNQCTIAVSFKPTATGTINGAVSITDNSSVKTQILDLSGKGTVPLEVSPTSLTFAPQHQGALSAPQTVTLTNHLKSAVNFGKIAVSGDYSITNTCGSSLAASASCTVAVTFSPVARTGTIPGTLTIISAAISSPQVVELTGDAKGSLPRFAYVANRGENTVSMYTVDSSTGQLRPNGYVLAGTAPIGVTVAHSGKFAYVVNFQDGTTSGYSINSTGRLTQIGAALATGTLPIALDITPSDGFVYVANSGDSTISAYAVNSKTGALSVVPGSPFPAGSEPYSVTVTPSGKFAYSANLGDNTVSAYSISASTGALTPVSGSPYPAGALPIHLTVDPTGKFAYVANFSGNTLSAYTINTSTGALTGVSGSPYGTGTNPTGVTVDHSGRFVFVVNEHSNDISAYAINISTGELAPVSGSPFLTAGSFPLSATIDATNQFLSVTDQGSNDVSTFAINLASGALTLLRTVSTRSEPYSIAMTSGSTPVTYTPRFAYVANTQSSTVSGYSINAVTGGLTPVSGSPFATGPEPLAVAADPLGRFVYATNLPSGGVSAYTIDGVTGGLTQISGSPFAAEVGSRSVIVDPSERFAYVANEAENNVSAYTLNAATGALTQVSGSPFTAGSFPAAVTMDPSGRFVYEVNQTGNDVWAYTVSAMTGALTPVSGSPFAAGSTPESVIVDPSGKFVYVANYASNSVSAYTINDATGALTPITGSFEGGGPWSGGVDPSGKFLYVANVDGNSVSAYTINAASGALTPVSGSPFAAGKGAISVAVDPSGKFAYVTNQTDNTVSAYTIAPSGALKELRNSPFATDTFPSAIAIMGKIH